MTATGKYLPPQLRCGNGSQADVPAYLSKVEADLWKHSSDLRRLLALKAELATKPAVDKHIQHNRKLSVQSEPGDKLHLLFLNQYANAMGEIMHLTGDTLLRVEHFLDIGCAPGGYSKRLLEENPEAQGTGVTLEHEDGGLAVKSDRWDEDVSKRFTLIEGDITNPSTHHIVKGRGGFDLVIAGATYRNPYTNTPEGQGSDYSFDDYAVAQVKLQLTQLVVALENLAEGGTLMMTLSMKGTNPFAALLCLRPLFSSIVAVKTRLRSIKSSFNLVCSGFRGDPTAALHKMNVALSYTEGEEVVNKDLQKNAFWNCVHPRTSVLDEEERSFVLELMEPLWKAQAQAVRECLAKQTTYGSTRPRYSALSGSRFP